jgi:DNA-binding NarL/FixJ family response regulator
MNTLVIIEDCEMTWLGIATYFIRTGRWAILGKASSLEEAEALFSGRDETGLADIVLLDVYLKDSRGLDLIPRLKEVYRGRRPPVVVYSVFSNYAHVKAALRCGAAGYVCKSQGGEELEAAMETVLKGGAAYSPGLLLEMAKVSDLTLWLTKRERQIFELVQNSKSNKEIAHALDIRVRTVENYLSVIYEKTGVKSRRELEEL